LTGGRRTQSQCNAALTTARYDLAVTGVFRVADALAHGPLFSTLSRRIIRRAANNSLARGVSNSRVQILGADRRCRSHGADSTEHGNTAKGGNTLQADHVYTHFVRHACRATSAARPAAPGNCAIAISAPLASLRKGAKDPNDTECAKYVLNRLRRGDSGTERSVVVQPTQRRTAWPTPHDQARTIHLRPS